MTKTLDVKTTFGYYFMILMTFHTSAKVLILALKVDILTIKSQTRNILRFESTVKLYRYQILHAD